jgi:hypothetical protein
MLFAQSEPVPHTMLLAQSELVPHTMLSLQIRENAAALFVPHTIEEPQSADVPPIAALLVL